MDLSILPVEVLEIIFSQLSLPSEQRNLRLVCSLWRSVVDRMRSLNHRFPGFSKFEQKVYLRLPVAGSLNEWHGNEGFAVIISTSKEVLIAGVGIFLPYGEDNLVADHLKARVELREHAVSQVGPVGQLLTETSSRLSRNEMRIWNTEKNCEQKRNLKQKNFQCLSGQWLGPHSRIQAEAMSSRCFLIHPYPIFFPHSTVLVPGVRYLISLFLTWEEDNEEIPKPVTTVWGFQGVPKITIPDENQGPFRWKQAYRKGLSSSITSGQFPVIYFIE